MIYRHSNYRRATNLAYAVRLHYRTLTANFDPFLVTSISENLRCCKFSTFCAMNGIDREQLDAYGLGDAFTVRRGDKAVIVYDETKPESRVRFTIAHELGHIYLGHEHDGEAEEHEADCFARNLLAPALLADLYGIPPEYYARVFGISAAAARVAVQFYRADINNVSDEIKKRVSDLIRKRA